MINPIPDPTPQQTAPYPIAVENDDAVAPDIILISSDDDEDEKDDVGPHPNLINWNWDDVIVILSDDEADAKTIDTQVSVIGRKRVYALNDESDNDEEYWLNAFLF
uniref:Uncharacterized protein n=1 Tax=Tanacetum cinerariifolium TaxID=118510 RepID=A0A699HYA8_TANCI|nr:hypothetical protein [Tanacetum cinerariifolium]